MTTRPGWSLDDLRPYLEVRFSRAGGPGGQNVNKLSTRVTLLLDFERCPHFSALQREWIRSHLAGRIGSDGRLRVTRQSQRSQSLNRRLAESRMLELLRAACTPPRVRHATRPTPASQVRRSMAKQRRAAIKRWRRSVEPD